MLDAVELFPLFGQLLRRFESALSRPGAGRRGWLALWFDDRAAIIRPWWTVGLLVVRRWGGVVDVVVTAVAAALLGHVGVDHLAALALVAAAETRAVTQHPLQTRAPSIRLFCLTVVLAVELLIV